MRKSIRPFGKLTLIQALKSTGFVCLSIFAINVIISILIDGSDLSKIGSSLITNIISWLWFGLFAVFESRKLEQVKA